MKQTNTFDKILSNSIQTIYNNSNILNNNQVLYNDENKLLSQIVGYNLSKHFNENYVPSNKDIDLIDYKSIFEYHPKLQKLLYNLVQKNNDNIARGKFAAARDALERNNQIKQYDNLGRIIDSQNNGANMENIITSHYEIGDDKSPDKQAELVKDLEKYATPDKTDNTKYILWISNYNDVCSSCKNRNYKLFSVAEHVFTHPNCRCKQLYFDGLITRPKSYLIVIFSGIQMEKGNEQMYNFGEMLKQKLIETNNKNKVDIHQIASYADDTGGLLQNDFTDDLSSVLLNSHSATKDVIRFTNEVITKYNKGKYDYVMFVGYSGGGVMASRVAENIKDRVPINKIFRIGSPNLNVNLFKHEHKTHDIALLFDYIPLTNLKRFPWDIKENPEYLFGYQVDGFDYHGAYFSFNEDKYGVSNLEKTVDAILKHIN